MTPGFLVPLKKCKVRRIQIEGGYALGLDKSSVGFQILACRTQHLRGHFGADDVFDLDTPCQATLYHPCWLELPEDNWGLKLSNDGMSKYF